MCFSKRLIVNIKCHWIKFLCKLASNVELRLHVLGQEEAMTMYVLPLLTLKNAIYLVSWKSGHEFFMRKSSIFSSASWNSGVCICIQTVYLCIYKYTQTHTNNFCLWQLVLTNKNRQQQNRFEQNQTTHSTGATSQCRTADKCAFPKLDLVPKVVKLITVVPKLGYNRIFNTAENFTYFTFNLRLTSLPPPTPQFAFWRNVKTASTLSNISTEK